MGIQTAEETAVRLSTAHPDRALQLYLTPEGSYWHRFDPEPIASVDGTDLTHVATFRAGRRECWRVYGWYPRIAPADRGLSTLSDGATFSRRPDAVAYAERNRMTVMEIRPILLRHDLEDIDYHLPRTAVNA